MVIDTGQIKAEMKREGKGKEEKKKKRNKISRLFQNCNRHVKCFPTFRADDLAGMPLPGHCTKNLISEQLE